MSVRKISSVLARKSSRRQFFRFMGSTTVGAGLVLTQSGVSVAQTIPCDFCPSTIPATPCYPCYSDNPSCGSMGVPCPPCGQGGGCGPQCTVGGEWYCCSEGRCMWRCSECICTQPAGSSFCCFCFRKLPVKCEPGPLDASLPVITVDRTCCGSE